jgi:TolB-like protein
MKHLLCMAIALLSAVPAFGAVKVVVLPFDVLGEAGHEWTGRAIQESLGTALQNARGISVVLAPAVSPTDASVALNDGRSAGADFVIFGTIQFVDDQMRVNGQVLNVASGQRAGSLISDSSLRDLFVVEDSLAHRAGLLISPPEARPVSPAGPRPEIQLVGPPLPAGPAHYFDGDITAVTAPAERFRKEYDQHYYYPTESDPAWGWGCYVGCGFGGFGGCGLGPVIFQTSVGPIGTW